MPETTPANKAAVAAGTKAAATPTPAQAAGEVVQRKPAKDLAAEQAKINAAKREADAALVAASKAQVQERQEVPVTNREGTPSEKAAEPKEEHKQRRTLKQAVDSIDAEIKALETAWNVEEARRMDAVQLQVGISTTLVSLQRIRKQFV